MANRRHSARRVKRLRTYNVREAAKVTGATPGTVRHWLKNGLESVADCYPVIIRGIDLIDFLKRREAGRKRPCGPGRLYCLRCKEPRRPAFDEVEFWPDGSKLGTLKGLCPTYTSIMHRRTSLARLKAAAGDLAISFPNADLHLGTLARASGLSRRTVAAAMDELLEALRLYRHCGVTAAMAEILAPMIFGVLS